MRAAGGPGCRCRGAVARNWPANWPPGARWPPHWPANCRPVPGGRLRFHGAPVAGRRCAQTVAAPLVDVGPDPDFGVRGRPRPGPRVRPMPGSGSEKRALGRQRLCICARREDLDAVPLPPHLAPGQPARAMRVPPSPWTVSTIAAAGLSGPPPRLASSCSSHRKSGIEPPRAWSNGIGVAWVSGTPAPRGGTGCR